MGGNNGVDDDRCHRLVVVPSWRRLLLVVLLLLASAEQSLALFGFGGGGGGDNETDTSAQQQCSQTCESEHCASTYALAPLMRYGKYCGVKYTGCAGEPPCDALDACCMLHDACVQATDNDYLNMWCNQRLLECVAAVRTSAAEVGTVTFAGNQCNVTDVADEITSFMEAAVFAERILHKP